MFTSPPESTYKYVEAKIKSKNEKKAFSDRWIGNKTFSKGERDNIEMKMCFGNKKEPDFFLKIIILINYHSDYMVLLLKH